MIIIDSNFDSGAIDVLDTSDIHNIRLNIRRDSASDFRQWFCFRVMGAKGQKCVIRLCNIGETSYKEGFRHYNTFVSTDFEHWMRIPCTIDNGDLRIEYDAPRDFFYVAYFQPYTWTRHMKLMAHVNHTACPHTYTTSWGQTVEKRSIDAVVVGEEMNRDKKKVWLIARQHPGETMAEFFSEGLIHRLLDPTDPVAQQLGQICTFYIVPNMNPDGTVCGNLRTNAAGKNLNREWLNPSEKDSPEVFFVRKKMHHIGVDYFFDIHGDETIPYVFTDPCLDNSEGLEAVEVLSPKERHLLDMMEKNCRDFQYQVGYLPEHYSREEVMSMARGYVSASFSCPSLVLEMPFKDHAPRADVNGWTSQRSITLGREWLAGLWAHLQAIGL